MGQSTQRHQSETYFVNVLLIHKVQQQRGTDKADGCRRRCSSVTLNIFSHLAGFGWCYGRYRLFLRQS
jgi:hypothetical protein